MLLLLLLPPLPLVPAALCRTGGVHRHLVACEVQQLLRRARAHLRGSRGAVCQSNAAEPPRSVWFASPKRILDAENHARGAQNVTQGILPRIRIVAYISKAKAAQREPRPDTGIQGVNERDG